MNSTSQRICTRFVPESITGGSAAGQRLGDWYRSLFWMKRTTEFVDQQESGHSAAEQPLSVPLGPTRAHSVSDKVVPDLYRRPLRQRLIDHLAARIIAALLYPAIAWAYRGERKAGTR